MGLAVLGQRHQLHTQRCLLSKPKTMKNKHKGKIIVSLEPSVHCFIKTQAKIYRRGLGLLEKS